MSWKRMQKTDFVLVDGSLPSQSPISVNTEQNMEIITPSKVAQSFNLPVRRSNRRLALSSGPETPKKRKLSCDESKENGENTRLREQVDPAIEVEANDEDVDFIPPCEQKPTEVPVTGLENLGNTCYLNSVLQALRCLPCVVEMCEFYVENIVHYIDDGDDNLLTLDVYQAHQLCAAVSKLVVDCEAQQSSCNPSQCILPTEVLSCILRCNCMFEEGIQQDANEALSCIINAFITVDKFYSAVDVPQPALSFTKCFTGKLNLRTRCDECEQTSKREEVFVENRVVIAADQETPNNWMVEACLTVERLTGANKYKCNVCMSYWTASRFTTFHTLPPVLVFQLLRFKVDERPPEMTFSNVICKQDSTERGRNKKNTKSNFWLTNDLIKITDVRPTPLSLDCFDPRCDVGCMNPSHKYDLQAVVVHLGRRISSGHYVAYVLCPSAPADACWIRCNDSSTIQRYSSEKLQRKLSSTKETPYLLFYKSAAQS